MTGKFGLYCSLLLICVVTVVCGNEDMRDVINQVGQLQADLLGKIVPSYVQNQVEQAMTRILGDQSIYDRVRHLLHNQQQMTRRIHSLERRLKTFGDDRNEKKKTVIRLQEKHHQSEVRMGNLQRELNTSQHHVSNVYSTLKMEDISRNGGCNCNSTSSTERQPTSTTPTYVATSSSRAVDKRNRIIVFQRSFAAHYPHQIYLHSNAMSTFSNLRPSNILSSAYDHVSRRIIFSKTNPGGIFSIRLDGGDVKTLRHNVMSYGVAIDADKRLIILTTYHPRRTISRMTATGKHYREIVDLSGYGSYIPIGIAINGRQKVIYFCSWNRLSSIDYDGKNLRTLEAAGRRINTVVFDLDRSCLFFGLDRNVMMKSLATNRNTEIMELGYSIWKFVLYNNSLYISSFNAGNIDVIHLDGNVYYNLKNMRYYNNDIILVP